MSAVAPLSADFLYKWHLIINSYTKHRIVFALRLKYYLLHVEIFFCSAIMVHGPHVYIRNILGIFYLDSPIRENARARHTWSGLKQQTPDYGVLYFAGHSCEIGETYEGSVV